MELTDVQKQAVKKWVEEGTGLSDAQKRIQSEFGITMTYMDVRFLVLDLGASVKNKVEPKPPAAPPAAGPGAAASPAADGRKKKGLFDVFKSGNEPAGAAGVSISVDRVMAPGSLVSGSVTFSDGVTAKWMLDQMGRLGLSAVQPGYRPSEADVQAFQKELTEALAKQGY